MKVRELLFELLNSNMDDEVIIVNDHTQNPRAISKIWVDGDYGDFEIHMHDSGVVVKSEAEDLRTVLGATGESIELIRDKLVKPGYGIIDMIQDLGQVSRALKKAPQGADTPEAK